MKFLDQGFLLVARKVAAQANSFTLLNGILYFIDSWREESGTSTPQGGDTRGKPQWSNGRPLFRGPVVQVAGEALVVAKHVYMKHCAVGVPCLALAELIDPPYILTAIPNRRSRHIICPRRTSMLLSSKTF